MDVLIIGATGYVGSAVDAVLRARGYRTRGTARSAVARAKLEERGTAVVEADAAKPATLAAAVAAADAVVYALSATDADPFETDLAAIRAIARSIAGAERSFLYVSGVWVYGQTDGVADEDAPLHPAEIVARRPELERMVLWMTKVGVRSHVVRPGIVYGGGAGVPAMFVASARERGAATIVGGGENHWPTIERGDLAELIARVLERGKPGAIYNAVGDQTFTVAEIAEAASRGAGADGRTTFVDPDLLGPFGRALALDQCISAERAKRDLGWRPEAPSILQDLEFGSYRRVEVAG